MKKKNNIFKFKIILIFALLIIFINEAKAGTVSVTQTTDCASVCTSYTLTTGATHTVNGSYGSQTFTQTFTEGATSGSTTNNCSTACVSIKTRIEGVLGTMVTEQTANISSNSLTRVMCNALRIVQGSAGKTFAAFAVIAVGIGFFSGKVSWGLMIGVAAGIASMFGAPSIVATISGQDTDMNCGTQL